MPSNNLNLSPDRRITSIAWLAACEKLDHFLRATPGYPELSPQEVNLMLDKTERALLDLRAALEDRAQPTTTST